MADQKLTQLTALTAAADTDLLYIVDDVSGTPVERKITVSDLKASITPTVLEPSGDATGATDSAAINAAANVVGAHVVLASGDWHVTSVGLTTNDVWLQGEGVGTVLNTVTGGTGITVTGPGNLVVSDMHIKGGDLGIVVNGAYDSTFRDLLFTGQAAGGIQIDGDLATEQNYVNVTMRDVDGIGFALNRTTGIYTGSLYLDRVRLVEPPTTATHGFRFRSTAASASLNIAFLTQCVADNYAGDGCVFENCAQVFVSQSWFAINGTSPVGSAALRVDGGFQHSYVNCYTYSNLEGSASPSVVIEGAVTGVQLGGGHVFDGQPDTVALGVAGITEPGGFTLGTHRVQMVNNILADEPSKVALPAPPLPGYTGRPGEETFHRMLVNNAGPLATETLVLTFFTATKTELISAVEVMTNDGASGQTYCGYGLYEVDENGLLTLVAKAEQTSSPNLWNSGYQPIGGFDTKLGFTSPATYKKQAGQKYAVGALFVGTTAPKFLANIASNGEANSNVDISGTPLGMLSAQKSGQTTLGALGTTHTRASLSAYAWVPYFLLT